MPIFSKNDGLHWGPKNPDPITEMANIGTRRTGLSVNIWAGPAPAVHGKRIKVMNTPGHYNIDDSFSVTLEPEPRIVAGIAMLSAKDLRKVFEFVKLNCEILLSYSNMEIDIDELLDGLKTV